jgi:subtilisin-like proprotein convertase family protein
MNPNGDPDYPNTLWDYTVTAAQVKYTYLVLTENTNLTTTPIKFAPVPFQGALTNLVSTNQVSVAISVEVTNTVVVTNTWVATNAVITGGTIMSDGFENAADAEGYVAGSIVSGWTVMSGDVDVFNPSVGHLATADTGTNHLDLNGFGPGAIATNFTTVVGQQYLLSFAYTKNPSTENPGYPYFIASANIDITGQPTLELDTPATMRNSYDDLNWQHAAIAFTATSTTTTLQFSSLNSGSGGMFLDTVKVTECAAFNGFEGAAAGDYVAGVNPNCDHWTVLSNQVTVISNATLANPAGAKLLALADGTISRTLPTVPGRTYTLSCAYRGPGAVSLWRGESNTVDSIGGNNGLLQGDLSYTNGEVNSAFNMRNSGYVFVHASPSLDVGPGPGFTIDAWVDPANISVPNPIVEWSQADGVYSGQQFFVTSTPQNVVPGSLFAGFVESNNVYLGDSFVSGANAVTNNGFQHVALTYNHATGDAAMYVNGAMVASKHINVVVPWTTGNVLIGRRINVNDGSQNFHFAGQEDEVSIYNRDLSASEIKAIYQKGGSGKYDTNAPSPAQGLAETQITVGSTAFPLFYGNNTNWQTTNFTFPATQSNMVLQITGLEPGMLLDNLALLQSAVTNFTYLTNTVVSTNTATNGFEGAVAGDYPQGQIFDGWVETGNQVTVITDPTLAVEGTNLLALADGTVTRVLPTLPGQTYTLTYAYRGPGAVALWRGETNVVDSISGNNGVANDIDYTDGQVGKAFVFNGTSSYIEVPASPSLDVGTSSSGFTLDTWVNWAAPAYLADLFEWNTGSGSGDAPVGLAFTIGPYNGTGDPNSGEGDLTANLEDTTTAFHTISTLVNLITVGSFQHVALTYDRISGNAVIYRNGVVEATANLGSSFTTQTTFPLYLGWRAAGSFASPAFNALQGALDEPTVYNRPLSASEIQAIYQKGGSGKFDPAAPTIAQGLAEAQVGVDGFYYPVFFGSNTNWLTNSITFTTSATQSNSVLQITGLEPGMLLDNFVLQQQVIVITDVVTTNLNGGDIFYLPEQSLDTLAGENAYGQWQLEVWDNRAGAYDTNLCQLINWQLRFNFATPINPIGSLTNGTTQTNIIAVGSIQYITVTVPTNADIATNILLFATNSSGTFTPLNIWFNQTTPPSGTNSPGDFLLISGTNGTSILYTNGVPPLVPGSTYYIGIQNTNGIPIDYGFRVDFHYLPVAIVLNGGQPQTNSVPTNSIVYYVVHVPTNADWATNLLLSASGPVNVWYNPTNLPVPANPPDTLLFGNATNGIAIFGTNTVPTLVPGTNYYLAVQNPGATSVTFGIEVDFHLVFSLPAGGIVFYPFTVPTNADFATNILPYASGPVNLWYDTNNPPTTNILLLPDATYPGGTNGSVVLSAGTTPPLVPGSTYWLGVQNTNSFPVIYDAPEVFFHLMPPPSITGPTITYTNIAGTNGFLLQWQGPTNFQYEIQWKTNLLPEFAWHTVVNPVINEIVTATNGHFSWFDDGTQTGGFGRMKFYRILGGQNLGPISGPGPVTNTVLAGSMSQAVVTVPANAISASNVLLSATGPLNVWFNQTNPPTGNTGAGDFLMLSASTAGTFVLTSNSVPPLVPGTNYYLGFQNPGTSNVLFVFQVAFGYAPTSAVSGFSITRTNGGIWLKWNGLTNYQYQVQWKTNLMPEVPWNTISNIVLTSTTGLFTFFDDGSLTGGFGPTKFYRLIVWPFMTPIPQTLSISSVTITNIAGTNDLVLTWSAPTNYQYGIKWTTNVALPFSSWSLITSPPPALANGIYTFIDNGLTGPPSAAKFFRLYEY